MLSSYTIFDQCVFDMDNALYISVKSYSNISPKLLIMVRNKHSWVKQQKAGNKSVSWSWQQACSLTPPVAVGLSSWMKKLNSKINVLGN